MGGRAISAAILGAVVVTAVVAGCASPEPASRVPAAPQAAAAVEPRAAAAVVPQATEAVTSQVPAQTRNPAAEEPQPVPQTIEPQEPVAQKDEDSPQGRSAFYRADTRPAEIPPVVLSKGHKALCRVKVGDTMPEIALPLLNDDGGDKKLAELFGEQATVVVFWNSDRRMAREALADLGPDVIDPFGERGVAVVGIVVDESPESAQAALREAGAEFQNFLDRDGQAFDTVGSEKLPRTFLLDSQGKILWFDIEYSLSTRRELHQALRAVAGEPH